ncbi:biopolymer transporter ExbD [Polaribacter vadi]|uniref:ExbD/TolR family protein n=1 Tax=Polaribacter TaxID=52959 RepID=UPI001C0A2A81|nr:MULTISPECIES: biopolymer transporter ExbD [Polaribacter]MBU3010766.1 biopolymer transporter ExbD [Polaribacter vadi]MDO6740577.1 biopolymer transporter ExbD [Polaribacter sp. 1_MG-2023]
MSRKESPEINAGSMADIAFLLLIFFLVTTTMNVDAGINRKIPKKDPSAASLTIKDKNILEVNINLKNEIFVEGEIVSPTTLKQIAIDFIDNGGGLDNQNKPCDWCNGNQLTTSSDHPTKAFISVKTDRNTNYETYILTLDNLNSAYTHLRNKLSVKMYGKNYVSLLEDYKKTNHLDKSLEVKIKLIREKYPLLLSDADIKN